MILEVTAGSSIDNSAGGFRSPKEKLSICKQVLLEQWCPLTIMWHLEGMDGCSEAAPPRAVCLENI